MAVKVYAFYQCGLPAVGSSTGDTGVCGLL